MKKFVFLYQGLGESTADAMQAWGAWFARVGEQMVDSGNPFGAGREVTPGGVTDLGAEAAPDHWLLHRYRRRPRRGREAARRLPDEHRGAHLRSDADVADRAGTIHQTRLSTTNRSEHHSRTVLSRVCGAQSCLSVLEVACTDVRSRLHESPFGPRAGARGRAGTLVHRTFARRLTTGRWCQATRTPRSPTTQHLAAVKRRWSRLDAPSRLRVRTVP